jgi:dolichyl-phosphate beta-glucosyltransferase
MKHLSLVIPAYNEEKILAGTLQEIITYLKKKKYSWEIVIVDDGSHDKTSEIAKKFSGQGVKLLTFKVNRGKGAALREGVLKSSGKYVIYTDADLSVSINYLDKMLKKLEEGYSVVIGSRRITGSDIVVHQPFIRERMGRVFTFLTRIVTGVQINDFTCGFKGFENKAGHQIFKVGVVDRWSYDAEIIFLAKKFGYKIGQVPVAWIDRRESRVKLGVDTFTSFKGLLKVRILDLKGVYGKNI